MMGSSTNSIGDYWVYVNHVVKKARIHQADCSYCQAGHGTHGGGDRASGFWKQFGNREDAIAFMRSVGYDDVRACKPCGG